MAARGEHDATVAADVKAAKTAAESAFVGVQALAGVATASPGLGELAAAVATVTEAVRDMPGQVQAAVKAAVTTPPVPGNAAETAAGPAPRTAPGSAGTSGKRPTGMGARMAKGDKS
jgi:hypothetical protein